MQEATPANEGEEENLPGVEEAVLRWRGSWAAAPGGVAVVPNGGEKFLPLPLSFFFFLPFLVAFSASVCFWFSVSVSLFSVC